MQRLETFARPGDERTPRVCWCMRVHRATIERAVLHGHTDVAAVRAATRATAGCGTCRIDVEEIIREVLSGVREVRP